MFEKMYFGISVSIKCKKKQRMLGFEPSTCGFGSLLSYPLDNKKFKKFQYMQWGVARTFLIFGQFGSNRTIRIIKTVNLTKSVKIESNRREFCHLTKKSPYNCRPLK